MSYSHNRNVAACKNIRIAQIVAYILQAEFLRSKVCSYLQIFAQHTSGFSVENVQPQSEHYVKRIDFCQSQCVQIVRHNTRYAAFFDYIRYYPQVMLRCEIGQIQIKIAARSFETAYRLHRIIVWFENHEIRVLLYSEIFVGILYLTNNFARMIQKGIS